MKKILLFPILLLLLASASYGQKSTIRFRLSDGDLIRVAVNGRYYNKSGHSLTVGDIPGKRQQIKIYRFRPYANQPGGKASLVFQGKIKIEKGSNYEAVVDAKSGQLYLTKVNQLNKQTGKLPPPEANHNLNLTKSGSHTFQRQSNHPVTENAASASSLSSDMEPLRKEMYSAVTDVKKLKIATNYLKTVTSITAEACSEISSWLLFDDSRIQFLKNAYPKIDDPENLSIVEKTFTETATKGEWQKYQEEQR